MRQKLLALMAACEGHVYGNMYAYFDKDIAGQIGQNPTQASFTQAVTASMTNQLTGLKTAFSNQNVALEIRIGETGWPTQGSQKGPAQCVPRQRDQCPVVLPGDGELVVLEWREDGYLFRVR